MAIPREEWAVLNRPPTWLSNHPAIQARGIELDMGAPLEPGCVFQNHRQAGATHYAVKILDTESEEADICNKLLKLSSASPNHTLPCDIILSQPNPPIIIMPLMVDLLSCDFDLWDDSTLLRYFHQILEGINFLHDLHIAHRDICSKNLVMALPDAVSHFSNIAADKIYIIDFGSSQQYKLGPGHQPSVRLGPAACRPPLNMDSFDPYSWDMYCTGVLFRMLAGRGSPEELVNQPWLIRRYVLWLIGHERGCTSVCHCRPSSRRAIQVLTVIRWMFRVSDVGWRVLDTVRKLVFHRRIILR